uniref:Perilipin-3 n=1 Tax=Piliocolobus tephrosceles TaxID=591936 RepID=A0A8C9HNN7_9PRIM
EAEVAPSVVDRVASMPLISSTCDMVSAAYASTKESYPHVKTVCDAAEKGVRSLTAAAVSGAQPILSKLEPQIASASEYAHRGLDKLEENLPILQQPTEKVTVSAFGDFCLRNKTKNPGLKQSSHLPWLPKVLWLQL